MSRSADFALRSGKGTVFTALLALVLISALSFSTSVLAQGTCPAIGTDNSDGRTTCAGLDVTIAAVRRQGGQPLACVPGTVLPGVMLELEFELSANGPRWDIVAGIQTANPALNPPNATLALGPGVNGTGPFMGQVGSRECVVAEMDFGLPLTPDDPMDPILFVTDEDGVGPDHADTCGDLPQGVEGYNATQPVPTGIDVVCTPDPVNGGLAVPTIVTWQDQGSTQYSNCNAGGVNAGWYEDWSTFEGGANPNPEEFLEEFQAAKCRVEDSPIAATIYGNLTIVKTTAGGDSTFNFDWSTAQGVYDPVGEVEIIPASAMDVPLMNGQSFTIHPILSADGMAPATNTITVTEDLPGGWELDSVSCVDQDMNPVAVTPNGNGIDVDMDIDTYDVTCTFTNSQAAFNFTVFKDFVPDNAMGSVSVTLDCTEGVIATNPLTASEGMPAVFTITGASAMATCTATEIQPLGYTGNDSDCQDDDLIGGSCTIVNTRNTAQFTVSKTYDDATVTPVSVTLSCTGVNTTIDSPNPADAAPGAPAVFDISGFEPGDTCTALETGVPAGYTADNSDCQDGDPADGGSCTIANTRNTGQFTVNKTYDDATVTPISVTLSCTGVNTSVDSANPADAAPGAPAVFDVSGFEPGDTCTALETGVPPGYTADNSDCQDGDPADGGSCTIANTRNTGQFTVNKTYDDATVTPVSVTLSCTGVNTTIDSANPADAAPGAPAVFDVSGFDPGDTCTALETGVPMGYTADNSDCQDGDPADGGSCTIVNTLVATDLSKSVNGPPTLEGDGTYTVFYTITATNFGGGTSTYDLVDNFSPGTGITLNTATATYQAGTENDQDGTLGAYPNFVTGESLGAGLNESWIVEANFTVDPTAVTPEDRDCEPGEPIPGTGFYNEVMGAEGEPEPGNNDTCEGLPDPVIDLAKNVVNFVDSGGGSITVTYEITATNLGDGPGFYDVVDTIDPAVGATIVSATLQAYVPGSENNQSGTILGDGSTPEPFTSGQTLVTGEALAGQRDESWTIVVEFDINNVTGEFECNGAGTGTYNEVSGSETDPNSGNNADCGDLQQERTTFLVTKDFSDDNPAGVTVSVECNTGLPLQQSGVVHDPDSNPGPGMFTEIEFVVGDFEPGTMDCDIEEAIPAGYVPAYTAGATTGAADAIFSDEDGCHYELIEGGQFSCHIFNELQPVDVIVEKEWIDEHPEFQQSTVVEVTLECDGPIEDGFPCQNGEGGNGNFCRQQFIDPNNPGEFEVLPHFEGTFCFATEEPIVGVLTDDSDCEEMIVFPGQGDSCVIVNTRLFAGIPTLNQYGLMLLALLMLGIGALAYRRFV